jgi:hypothetical protein
MSLTPAPFNKIFKTFSAFSLVQIGIKKTIAYIYLQLTEVSPLKFLSMNFKFADTWLLHSILSTEKNEGATLKEIIAFADYTNHAVITYEELTDSLARLTSLGLVKKTRENFSTTDEIKEWFRTKFSKKIRMNFEKECRGIENYLVTHFPEEPGKTVPNFMGLNQEEYKKKLSEYFATA